jgi:hypothetical protein
LIRLRPLFPFSMLKFYHLSPLFMGYE